MKFLLAFAENEVPSTKMGDARRVVEDQARANSCGVGA
jgi:hypothetical protein